MGRRQHLDVAVAFLAVVIWALPAQLSIPGGVNVHRIRALSASMARVLPQVVVTTITLCVAPPTLTPWR